MLTPHELFGFMSPALANEILAFAHEADKPLYRATVAAVAQLRKVRPIFLERQPRVQRDAAVVAALARPALDAITGNLIRSWLVKKHGAMLAEFLDHLGIKHEAGVVEGLPDAVEDAQVVSAVELLLSKHPAETVAVYLNAFRDMNDVAWPALKRVLETDSRLQLGG